MPDPIDFRGVPFPHHPTALANPDAESDAHRFVSRALLSPPPRRDVRGQPFAAHLAPGRKRARSRVYHVAALFAGAALLVWIGSQAYITAEMDIAGSLAELRYQRGNYYDIRSAPKDLVLWVGSRLAIGKDCAARGDHVLIARCCAGSCGGFSDRARGLGALLHASEAIGRRLCIAPDYFMAGTREKCEDGAYTRLATTRAFVYNTSSATAFRPASIIPGRRTDKAVLRALRESKYVSCSEWSTVPRLGLRASSSRKLGMLILAMSRSINSEMLAARRAVRAVLGLYDDSARPRYIGWHIRVGGSAFTLNTANASAAPHRRRKTTSADRDFDFAYPDAFLTLARKLPRSLSCNASVYVTSDSRAYLGELTHALPGGVPLLSCCAAARHVGKPLRAAAAASSAQHLADLQGLGGAARVFASAQGFGVAAAATATWAAPPVTRVAGAADAAAATAYFRELLAALGCAP